MKGRLCKFWNNDREIYYGILTEVKDFEIYPYKMLGCGLLFKNCEVLSIFELKDIQENGIYTI